MRNSVLTIWVLLLGTLLSSSIYAARLDIDADISLIRFHESDNTLAPAWTHYSWFTITNVTAHSGYSNTNLANCRLYGGQTQLVFSNENSHIMAALLSAKAQTKRVYVTLEDTVQFDGACRVQYLTLM